MLCGCPGSAHVAARRRGWRGLPRRKFGRRSPTPRDVRNTSSAALPGMPSAARRYRSSGVDARALVGSSRREGAAFFRPVRTTVPIDIVQQVQAYGHRSSLPINAPPPPTRTKERDASPPGNSAHRRIREPRAPAAFSTTTGAAPCSSRPRNWPAAPYRCKTKVGNWLEDMCLQEEKLSEFARNRDEGRVH